MATQHNTRSSLGFRWWVYIAMIAGLLAAYGLGALQGEFQPAILTVSIGAAAGWVAWCLFGDRARGRLRCPRCGYDTSGNREKDLTCPECGKTVRSRRGFLRTKRHSRRAIVGVLPILLGVGTWMYVMAKQHGWANVLPDIALALVAPMDHQSELYEALWGRLERESLGPISKWIVRRRVGLNLYPENNNWWDAASLLPEGEMAGFERDIIKSLTSTNDEVVEAAADRLIETPLSADARAALVQAVQSWEQRWIEGTAEVWSGTIGDANLIEVAPTLDRVARESASERNRLFAIGSMIVMKPSPPALKETLVFIVLSDKSRMVRDAAASGPVFWEESQVAPEVAQMLLELFIQNNEAQRVNAIVRGMGLRSDRSDMSMPILVSLLNDSVSPYRLHAIRSLGNLGELAKDALPALEAIAFDPTNDPQTISAAFTAIQAINAELP